MKASEGGNLFLSQPGSVSSCLLLSASGVGLGSKATKGLFNFP